MLTNYPNGLTSFGVPLIGNGLPLRINSTYYFVDGTNGSDGNSGTEPALAFATIAKAITVVNAKIDWSATRWATTDIIVIAPGVYAENLTSLPYGAVLYGCGYDNRDAQNGVKIKPASGAPVDVDSVINTEFYNIGFETADTTAGHRVFDATIINNCTFVNCRFEGPAETATAVGVYTSDATRSKWINCEIACCDKGFQVEYADENDGFNHCLLDGCIITQCDTAGIYLSANLVGPSSVVRNCFIGGSGQTMTKGIDDNSGVLDEAFNAIEATTAVEGVRSSNGSYGSGVLLT